MNPKILIISIILIALGIGGFLVWKNISIPKEGIPEEVCTGMTLTEAREIARSSECGDRLKDTYICNEDTGTWWIDLDIEKEGCNPACVVNVKTKTAAINWRCTGVILEPEATLRELCEENSWPPDCNYISHLPTRELCEKCKELRIEEEKVETIEPADLTQVTFLNYCSDPDWSSNGSQIIFERQKEGDRGIYLINADGTGLTKIGLGHNPSWSPVDNRIIYRGGDPWRSLFLVDLDEGWENKVKLVDQINEHGGWSPDGKKIVYDSPHSSESSSIWVVNSDGSEKTRLTTNEDGYCMGPSFNYDGSKIVYLKGFTTYAVGGSESEEINEIWVMDSDGSNKHMIYTPGDSSQLIFQRAWNKNNKILFMRTWYHKYPPQVWIINSDGSDPKSLVAGSDVFGDPVWDNSGTKVAISKSPLQLMVPGDIWIFSYK